MVIKTEATKILNSTDSISVSLRCPVCRQIGTMENLGHDLLLDPITVVGDRRCPNTHCHAHIFVTLKDGQLIASYPPETIDFDTTGIPPSVVESFSEAIICHANECYVAAAIMVRKTLEELCNDQKAQGSNLHKRLEDLFTKIVVPEGFSEGVMDLKLLGNDAAHIESQTYRQIGKVEVELGIDIAKNVLLALYQFKGLMNRLGNYKVAEKSYS